MEFKKEELVDREMEIGSYLLQGLHTTNISKKTGLSKKTITAHIRNMMEKLKADDTIALMHKLSNRGKNNYEL